MPEKEKRREESGKTDGRSFGSVESRTLAREGEEYFRDGLVKKVVKINPVSFALFRAFLFKRSSILISRTCELKWCTLYELSGLRRDLIIFAE